MSQAHSAFSTSAQSVSSPQFRWGQLLMGVICMAMIANLQYGWTLFVNPYCRLAIIAMQMTPIRSCPHRN